MLVDLQKELRHFQIPCRGVIQVGAHEGQEVDLFVALGLARVHLVEPNPEVFGRLLRNTAEVARGGGVTLSNVALSDRNGEADLNVTNADQSSSLLDLRYHRQLFPGIDVVRRIKVETRRLDDHLVREGIDAASCNVLVVDTQGAELAVLRGGSRYLGSCDAVLVEANFAELYAGCPEIEEIDAFLFDLGFVRVRTGLWSRHWGDALYVRSERIADPFDIAGARRGVVQIPDFGKNGRFANQLFQFAFAYFYALRSGAGIALPDWRAGTDNFGFPRFPRPRDLPVVRFRDGNRDHLAFWNLAKPVRDIGFSGYFQDLAPAVKQHKALFRRLFSLRKDVQDELDKWVSAVTGAGTRPLIALHVRRGDYAAVDPRTDSMARVPTEWYVAALRAELTLRPDAAIHVSTDDAEVGREILQAVGRSGPAHVSAGPPEYIRDFYALRVADVILICNSSYSRMAALLAKPGQRTLLINFATGGFEPYDAWADEAFWFRFSPQGEAARRGSDAGAKADDAAGLVAAADRVWAARHRLRLWFRTTGRFSVTRLRWMIRRLWPRRLRTEFLSPDAYRQRYDTMSAYWRNIPSGEVPKEVPRWRFFSEL